MSWWGKSKMSWDDQYVAEKYFGCSPEEYERQWGLYGRPMEVARIMMDVHMKRWEEKKHKTQDEKWLEMGYRYCPYCGKRLRRKEDEE